MREPAVEIENLHKRFKIYQRPSDRLKELLGLGKRHRDFWALRGIDLTVRRGEALGIIGVNGSGKSTLLQIIAGTMKPTRGRVKVRGKVAALLELGIGFHPELTGRENLKLASSIMGIKLDRKTEEEIIEFAEIGEFIDAPVKTYSSGMFVRLAFSLAVCVDPDVLIVDEALSVGDIYFQKKSFDRILRFKEEGKTLIFCSHSMYHVNHLCDRAVWLEGGRVKMDGPASVVTTEYEKSSGYYEQESQTERDQTLSIKLYGDTKEKEVFRTGEAFRVQVSYSSPMERNHLAVGISQSLTTVIYATSTQLKGLSPLPSEGCVFWEMESLPLLPGQYEVTATLLDDTGNVVIASKHRRFTVEACTEEAEDYGIVRLEGHWETVDTDSLYIEQP